MSKSNVEFIREQIASVDESYEIQSILVSEGLFKSLRNYMSDIGIESFDVFGNPYRGLMIDGCSVIPCSKLKYAETVVLVEGFSGFPVPYDEIK